MCRLRAFWRAVGLTASVFLISKQWGDLDMLLPTFLERHAALTLTPPPSSQAACHRGEYRSYTLTLAVTPDPDPDPDSSAGTLARGCRSSP